MDNLYLLLSQIAFVIALINLNTAFFQRGFKGSMYYLSAMLSIFIYVTASIFEASAVDRASEIMASRFEYIGMPFVMPFLFLYFLDFGGVKINPLQHVFPIMIFPAMIAALSFFAPNFLVPAIEERDGIIRYIYFLYAYIMILASAIFIVIRSLKRDAAFKKQAIILVAIVMLLTVSNIITEFLRIMETDLTPLILSLSGMALSIAVISGRVLQIAPVARDCIMENMQNGFILISTDGKFLDANKAAKSLFPALNTVALGLMMKNIEGIPWGENGLLEEEFSRTTGDEVRHYKIAHEKVLKRNRPICDCVMIYDNTDMKKLMNELIKTAEYDLLTGLINKKTFYREAEKKCAEIERYGGSASALMMDLDNFKVINDTFGHLAGDVVLKTVFGKMSERFRQTDLFARYGGEEFCALLFLTDASEAMNVAEACRKTAEDLVVETEGKSIRVTVSIGVAEYEQGKHSSVEELLSQADKALYVAKRNGRNRVENYTIDE